jgi:quercetin dioxygenase-like cupin family protein
MTSGRASTTVSGRNDKADHVNRRDLTYMLPMLGLLRPAWAKAADAKTGEVLRHSFGHDFSELSVSKSASGATMRPIVDGTLPTGEAVEIHQTTLQPGQMPHPPHHHVHEEFMLVREGSVEFTAAGTTHKLGPGGAAYAASNEEHGLKNVGDVPATYFVIAIGPK